MSAAGLATILSGCATTDIDRASETAAAQAVAESRANLPPWPAYCREHMGKVIPKEGEPVYGPQIRWEAVRRNGNQRIDWCADYYDSIRDEQARGGRP